MINILEILMITSLTLSMLSSTSIVLLIRNFPKPLATIQVVMQRIFSYDILFSLSQLIVFLPIRKYGIPILLDNYICVISGTLRQFSTIGLIINCYLLSFYSYQGLLQNSLDCDDKIFISSLAIQTILSVIPIITQSFQNDDLVCLPSGTSIAGNVETLFIFYLPLIICFSLSLIYLYKTYKLLQSMITSKPRFEVQMAQRIVKMMILQPLIFFICWISIFVYRVGLLSKFIEENNDILHVTVCITFLQGFFMSFLYMYFYKSQKICESNFEREQIQKSMLSEDSQSIPKSSNDDNSYLFDTTNQGNQNLIEQNTEYF